MLFRAFDPFAPFDWVFESAPVAPARIPMDAVKRDDQVVVSLDLPGVDAASIDITVDGRTLTVEATRPDTVAEGDTVLTRERRGGVLRRQFQLGETLDPSAIEADYRDGVLVLTIPLAPSAKPRKVLVAAGTASLPEGESGGEGTDPTE